MNNHSYFCNANCEYFPCHQTDNSEDFNCLFCFCPLYYMGENCGGNFVILESGIKDCSGCLIPHKRENYTHIIGKLSGKE